ncbi:hypothetical protein CLV62_1259 [Dysgonomonas alginatilytica]|uniref:Uncharacterized protein n=1 Tax=Dysgonomonas alginatilytica TaxID=1605892 RepID=A0A2V3PLU9_9BACT|nr:hypothetical protein [Dysgonomonas alginatilytica]PXV61176.1 hypothetical protein CLV62_1259 [Dysgonomonas alginatilytica]
MIIMIIFVMNFYKQITAMAKSKYIKVTDEKGKSSVVLGINEAFYRSQKYKISEPTKEEIQEYFPSVRDIAPSANSIPSTPEKVNVDLHKEKEDHLTTKNDLLTEKQAHADTGNKLKLEQEGHASTKNALEALNIEFGKEKQAHADTGNKLKLEQEGHASTKNALEALNIEFGKEKQAHADTKLALENLKDTHKAEIEKLQSELKKKA